MNFKAIVWLATAFFVLGADLRADNSCEVKAATYFGSTSIYEKVTLGLGGSEVVGSAKFSWLGHNKDFGFGFEDHIRTFSIEKNNKLNAGYRDSKHLNYSVLAVPIFFTFYLPLKTTWFRPGLEFSASYLRTLKEQTYHDAAISTALVLKFQIGDSFSFSLQSREQLGLNIGGLESPVMLENLRAQFGGGLGWAF